MLTQALATAAGDAYQHLFAWYIGKLCLDPLEEFQKLFCLTAFVTLVVLPEYFIGLLTNDNGFDRGRTYIYSSTKLNGAHIPPV
ncbi:unnamed protein product, partial [marine sediment metagenome]